MQGSYGGVLMFGMLTSLAGLGMFNPLSLGAGALMGRAAYKENMENRMLRARSEAKMNMRRFVDEVSFVVSKESRDRLKGIQRQLRDHYRAIANQATRSLNESLQATIASAKLQENERNARIKELERQLNILRQVTEHAVKLVPMDTGNLGLSFFTSCKTSRPLLSPKARSRITTSQSCLRTSWIASCAVLASPKVTVPGGSSNIRLSPSRTTVWSSTIRIFVMVPTSVQRWAAPVMRAR